MMKIKIVTEREILEEDLDDYLLELINSGVPINSVEFKRKGTFKITDNLGYTNATTTYEMVKS